MNPLTQSKNTTILPVLIALTLGCFALSPQARAVCQEGCLTNEQHRLGEDALFSLTTGIENTAIGLRCALLATQAASATRPSVIQALFSNTTGNDNTANGFMRSLATQPAAHNTATGDFALYSNTTGDVNTANGHFALFYNTTGKEHGHRSWCALWQHHRRRQTRPSVFNALLHNTTGSNNIALGASAGRISPRAVTISISATRVLLASPTPFASATQELRAPHLSPASAGQPCRQV